MYLAVPHLGVGWALKGGWLTSGWGYGVTAVRGGWVTTYMLDLPGTTLEQSGASKLHLAHALVHTASDKHSVKCIHQQALLLLQPYRDPTVTVAVCRLIHWFR